MTSGSLKRRLLMSAAISLLLALGVASLGLSWLFERHVERRVVAELSNHMEQIIGGLSLTANGAMTLTKQPADTRFSRLLSGIYWQVDSAGAKPLRSRSLWDQELTVTGPPSPVEAPAQTTVQGPRQQPLFALYRDISIKRGINQRRVRISVTVNRKEIDDAVAGFRGDVALFLFLLGIILIIASWVGIEIGIKPIESLRQKLSAIRAGTAPRLEGQFPSEVAPLANDLNALLEAQEVSIRRARTRAANLAHGLKTPLTIMGGAARKIGTAPADEITAKINHQIQAMQRHIENELARSSLAGGAPLLAACSLVHVVNRIKSTMQKLPCGTKIKWRIDVSETSLPALDEHDLTEIIGNLMDNARKWALSVVVVKSIPLDSGVRFIVEDDGPGLIPSREMIGSFHTTVDDEFMRSFSHEFQRTSDQAGAQPAWRLNVDLTRTNQRQSAGKNASASANSMEIPETNEYAAMDEHDTPPLENPDTIALKDRQGSGLGLSIAGEIARSYGGKIELFHSELGGLGVRVDLPQA